nr:SDR family NAD(P)-dependent oxidoreductase [uncultured Cohaesibacter sp.]
MAISHQGKWQRVWIIGASSGMGARLAVLFAKAGAEVIVSARSVDKLEALSRPHERMVALPLDVQDGEAIAEAINQLASNDQLPDLTVYCAAVYEPGGVEALSHHEAARHMMVNYLGAVGVIAGLFPRLKQQGRGGIAIVSSLTSYCGLPMAAHYGPTKAALASLCETLKPEFDAAGLVLHLINPGFVETPLTARNRFPMPFLMSDEAAAQRMFDGLRKKAFEIAFPFPMALALRLLRALPYSLYFRLMRRLIS